MQTSLLVYVLILNYNGEDVIADCVGSVLKSDYPNLQIVVIDNGSKDTSIKTIKEKFNTTKITIIENGSNLGYSRGFNVGLKYAFEEKNADYCLIMNFDTIIDTKAINELLRIAQQDEKIGFVTGKVYYYDRPNILQTVGKKEDSIRWNGEHIGRGEEDKGQYDEVCERHFIDDVFTLVSRNLYKDIGGYNPIFFLEAEQYDWQARAKKQGYKIIYTPYAKLWHRESYAIGKNSAKKFYYDARNPLIVIMLHKSPPFFRRYLQNQVKRTLLASFKLMIKLRFYAALKNIEGLFSGIWWGIRNKKLTRRHFINWGS